jgi:enamine deaminase RidA (YjgF/YER057c/UK114 family)
MARIVSTPNAPSGTASGPFPYSQAVVAGGLIFVSGQGPFDPATGAIVGSTIQEQTRQASGTSRRSSKPPAAPWTVS